MKAIVALFALAFGSIATADECADRIDRALTELRQLVPQMDDDQAGQAERILGEICVAPEPKPAPAEPETPSVLGVEFDKAEPDSKGHARLRKSH